jgi:hypothetical protein
VDGAVLRREVSADEALACRDGAGDTDDEGHRAIVARSP